METTHLKEIENEIYTKVSIIKNVPNIDKFELLEILSIELMQANLNKKVTHKLLEKINSSLECI